MHENVAHLVWLVMAIRARLVRTRKPVKEATTPAHRHPPGKPLT